jgi:PKD repeat protein
MSHEMLQFNVSDSFENTSNIVSYRWNFDDGTVLTSETPIATHWYDNVGIYKIAVIAYDANGPVNTLYMDLNLPSQATQLSPTIATALAASSVTVAAIVTGLAAISPSAISNLPIPDQVKKLLNKHASKILEQVSKKKVSPKKRAFIIRQEILATAISILIITIVVAAVKAGGPFNLFIPALPTLFTAAFMSTSILQVSSLLSDAFCTKISSFNKELNLWKLGSAIYFLTGLVFMFPFSSPTITRSCDGIPKKTKALMVLARTLVVLTLTIYFALMTLSTNSFIADIGDAGIFAVLITAVSSFMPIWPMPGKAIFEYKKPLALILVSSFTAIFYFYSIGFLPLLTYAIIGVFATGLSPIAFHLLSKAR